MLLRVLVMESEASARRQLRQHLDRLDQIVVVGEALDTSEALAIGKKGVDIAIVEIPEGAGERQALDCIAHLLRQIPGISVMASGAAGSADVVIRAIRAGAVEFLRRPISHDDLAAAVEKIRRLRKGSLASETKVGRIVAVYSTKGGLGVTTLATNMAACLAQGKPGDVVILDLDLHQGGVSTLLNLHPTYSIMDAFEQVGRLDEIFLRGLLTRHSSGLEVLPAPAGTERSRFAPEQIRGGLGVVRSHFSHVILDLPHDLDPGTVAALEASDEILFMVGLNVPAIRSAAAGLSALRHLGVDQRKVKVVVSRANAQEEVSVKQAREALGLPVFWRVPNDYPTVLSSINAGTPFVLATPRTEIARNLRQLSENVSLALSAKGQSKKEEAHSLIRRVLPFAT